MSKKVKIHIANETGHTTVALEEVREHVSFTGYNIVAVAGEIVKNYDELITQIESHPEEEVDVFVVPQMAGG